MRECDESAVPTNVTKAVIDDEWKNSAEGKEKLQGRKRKKDFKSFVEWRCKKNKGPGMKNRMKVWARARVQ